MRHVVALTLIAATSIAAQAPREAGLDEAPRYERVVITSHDPDDHRKSDIALDGRGALAATNITLQQLIVKAFGVRPQRVAGGPEWIGTDRFDVAAVPPAGSRRVDANAMVQLLEDRFHLEARWEPHRIPVYLLKRGKGKLGRGVRPPSPGCENARGAARSVDCQGGVGWNGPGWLFVKRGPVSSLAAFLPSEVGREVLDQTGLKGTYDIDVKFVPGPDSPFQGLAVADLSSRPDVFTAVREQLGFELEPSTAELPVQWIEHAERPQFD